MTPTPQGFQLGENLIAYGDFEFQSDGTILNDLGWQMRMVQITDDFGNPATALVPESSFVPNDKPADESRPLPAVCYYDDGCFDPAKCAYTFQCPVLAEQP